MNMTHSLERRLEHEDELQHIRQALDDGKITKKEYDALLAHDYGILPDEKVSRWPVALAAMVIIGVFGLFALWGGSITGFVTLPGEVTLEGGVYTQTTSIPLNITNATMIRASGTLTGGTVALYVQKENETYLLYQGTATLANTTLANTVYALNESINVTTNLENYTLWVTDSSGNKTPVANGFALDEQGTYTLSVLTSEEKVDIAFSIGNESVTRVPTLTFSEECVDTCNMSGITEPELLITLSEGAELDLTGILVVQPIENTAPEQVIDIPDIALEETTTIDLDNYFLDRDGDELTYEINNIIGIEEDIDGSLLTLSGTTPGTYDVTLYVSDLKVITLAEFTVVVIEQETNTTQENVTETTNTTTNSTANTTEETANETVDETPVARPQNPNSLRCDHPNINKRPPECFAEQFDLAFEEVDAPLKNGAQTTVGRFTRLGNLIISGVVIEESTGNADTSDFKIGQTVTEGFITSFDAAAWIDTETGNLHLRGNLYEEVPDLAAPQYNSYTITNRHGIILGYFDEVTGDLFLKGNIVQLGKP